MITAISGLSFKIITPQNNSKTDFKTNPLKDDSFKLQSKLNPSFGKSIVPRKAIFTCCDKFLAGVEKIEDLDTLANASKRFIDSIRKILDIPQKYRSDNLQPYKAFKHDLFNSFCSSKFRRFLYKNEVVMKQYYPELPDMHTPEFVSCYKQELKNVTERLKDNVEKTVEWDEFLQGNDRTINVSTIFDKLTSRRLKESDFSIEGMALLADKKMRDPMTIYFVLSQPFLNAQKYGEGKPFKIVIEKTIEAGKERYFASFINPDTNPIPDDEIDKILQGKKYRASNALQSGIDGTGFGFQYLVETLRRSCCGEDIPNLIQKGRERGVCVRVPIIGIV